MQYLKYTNNLKKSVVITSPILCSKMAGPYGNDTLWLPYFGKNG